MAEEFDQDVGEKTEEPPRHRIEEFRRRGEVASSKELTGILVLSISVATLILSMVYIYQSMAEFLKWAFELPPATAFSKESLKLLIIESVWTMIKCVIPIFIAVVIVVFIANILQVGFLFSPEVLAWKYDRINPVSGLKRLFSMQSVMEALKGFLKFLFIIAVVFLFLREDIKLYQGFYHLEFIQIFLVGQDMIVKLVFFTIGALFLVAGGDFAYQKIRYQNRLRMTKEQAKRDQKEYEGGPEIKQRIRGIQREMSNRRMMNKIKDADVVVTNPTHFSVALKYDEKKMISPIVVAKGADYLALRIRKVAEEYNIPMVENVPLARALYETVKLDSAIPRTLYNAVAEVLSFVYKLNRKKKALNG